MHIVTLSGWGQMHDSLKVVIPEGAEKITHIKYSDFSNFEQLRDSLKGKKINCDVLIGWSLGGQLAIRLIEQGILKPSLLVLLAAPYQFIADRDVSFGMQSLAFMAFKNAFSLLPAATLKRFAVMMVHNDSHLRDIIHNLSIDKDNVENWISWLDEIAGFSCKKINFTDFPRTLLIHGDNDEIVSIKQARLFAKSINDSELIVFESTGHAPHLHDPESVKNLIKQEIINLK